MRLSLFDSPKAGRGDSVCLLARCAKSLRSRVIFVLVSKLYRQMYANTGIATDSARVKRAGRWARWLAKPCLRLFQAPAMPGLPNFER